MLLMGKSTISTGPFSIATLNYQRVTCMLVCTPEGPIIHHATMCVPENAD